MHGPQREPCPRAGMTLPARARQVLGVDGGVRVRGRQNVMHPVATGAIGHRLRASRGRQAVVGSLEADHPVRRHPELAGQAHVAVAPPARLGNVAGVHQRGAVGGRLDGVLPVAIRADRRLRDPLLQGFAMHAQEILLGNPGMAHTAGLWHLLAERLGVGGGQLVGASVADGAIRGSGVSLFQRQSVYALSMLTHLGGVAPAASGFRDAFRMGVHVMLQVAGGARDRCVGGGLQLLPLVVAIGTGAGRQLAHRAA